MSQLRPTTTLATLLAFALLGACKSDSDSTPGVTGQSIDEARSNLPQDMNPNVAAADEDALRAGNLGFAFDLYGELATSGENFFCSPASVSIALAMTYAGAKAQTEAQMAQALHFTLPQATLHPAFDKLLLALATRNIAEHATDEGPKSLKLEFSNAAWAQKGYAFVPSYLDTIALDYGAGVKLLDFATDPAGATDAINTWVAGETEGKITDLIPSGAITALTRLVLTNTLYFHGSWRHAFVKDLTADEAFHAPAGDVTAAMMHGEIDTSYAEGNGWQLANLPYDGDDLEMTVIVPAAGRFDEIRGALDPAWLAQADAAASEHLVDVSLPKFRFAWGSASLKASLEALGMTDAFDSQKADFTGMEPTGELYIGDVLHKAFVGVDESGTEAAAATAVLVLGGGVPDATIAADRPFVFVIRDTLTGSVLFVGQVVDPSQS